MEEKHWGFKFDSSIINKEEKLSSSLTELNRLPIFTEEFRKKIEKVRAEELSKKDFLRTWYFTDRMKADDYEELLLGQMFKNVNRQVIKAEYQKESENVYVLYGIAVCFLVFLIGLIFYSKRRNKKTELLTKRIEEEGIMREKV